MLLITLIMTLVYSRIPVRQHAQHPETEAVGFSHYLHLCVSYCGLSKMCSVKDQLMCYGLFCGSGLQVCVSTLGCKKKRGQEKDENKRVPSIIMIFWTSSLQMLSAAHPAHRVCKHVKCPLRTNCAITFTTKSFTVNLQLGSAATSCKLNTDMLLPLQCVWQS